MGQTPEHLKYAKTHEWALAEDAQIKVGITDFAQEQLGDVVFIDLPAVGRKVKQGEECATIESVKAASGIHSPVSGEIIAVNGDAQTSPEQVNEQPYACWLFCIRPDDAKELDNLLSAAAYQAHAESGG
jgi:glycine cleavage system H protein